MRICAGADVAMSSPLDGMPRILGRRGGDVRRVVRGCVHLASSDPADHIAGKWRQGRFRQNPGSEGGGAPSIRSVLLDGTGSTWALSIIGVAGPEGSAMWRGVRPGDRTRVRLLATRLALDLRHLRLDCVPPPPAAATGWQLATRLWG